MGFRLHCRLQVYERAAGLARPGVAAHIQAACQCLVVPAVRDILKFLNDRSAGDLADLNDDELQSFEALCENWRTQAEAERARRKSLPPSAPGR